MIHPATNGSSGTDLSFTPLAAVPSFPLPMIPRRPRSSSHLIGAEGFRRDARSITTTICAGPPGTWHAVLRSPAFSAVAVLDKAPSVFALISAAMFQNDGSRARIWACTSIRAAKRRSPLRGARGDPSARRITSCRIQPSKTSFQSDHSGRRRDSRTQNLVECRTRSSRPNLYGCRLVEAAFRSGDARHSSPRPCFRWTSTFSGTKAVCSL